MSYSEIRPIDSDLVVPVYESLVGPNKYSRRFDRYLDKIHKQDRWQSEALTYLSKFHSGKGLFERGDFDAHARGFVLFGACLGQMAIRKQVVAPLLGPQQINDYAMAQIARLDPGLVNEIKTLGTNTIADSEIRRMRASAGTISFDEAIAELAPSIFNTPFQTDLANLEQRHNAEQKVNTAHRAAIFTLNERQFVTTILEQLPVRGPDYSYMGQFILGAADAAEMLTGHI